MASEGAHNGNDKADVMTDFNRTAIKIFIGQ